MGRLRLILGFSLLVGSSLLTAEAETTGTAVEIGPVLVAPRRIPGLSVSASEFPGNATVITSKEIRRSGASSLPELLGRYEGVAVMDTNGFGLGADGSVNLRGVVNSSRTNALVLVDGVRQNRVTGDEVHWQSIPLSDVERIEIIRGGGSLIYGEGALSGLISITTKHDPQRFLEAEEGVELGSFGQQRYRFSARGRSGPWNYGTHYHRELVSGYRESTSSRTTTLTSHIGVEALPGLRMETRILHSEDTTGFAGGITPEASQERRRQHGSFPGFFDDHTEQVSMDVFWHGPEGFSLVTNAFWRLRESDSFAGGRFATISPSKGLSLRGAHEQELGSVRHTLVSGVELLDEKASTGLRGSGFSESNKTSYGLYAEETVRLMDRVSLIGGIRYDRARFEEDISFPAFVGTLRFEGWSPKAGLSIDLARPLTVYASFARPFKAPNVDDFAAAIPGQQFVGNIDLNPQQGSDYELGFRFTSARFGQLHASWFYAPIDEEILFNDLPGNDQNQNFDTLRTGVEASLSPHLPVPRLSSTFTYTFIEAEFRKGPFKGNTLPGTPEHRFSAGLTYEPIPPLLISLDWLLVSDFFRINDFNNVLPGDNYGVLNLSLRWRLDPYTLYFKIHNLTNEEYTSFQSSNGVAITSGENPAPPIAFIGGVQVSF